MMLNICTKFKKNISKGVRVIERLRFVYWKFSNGHNSVHSVGGVMIFILSTSSDSVLYLYQVLSKYLIGFLSYGPEQ